MNQVRGEFDFSDLREFSLVEYRHGHSYAVIRGFPPIDDDAEGGSSVRVLDIFFAGVERISCWKDLGQVRLRRASKPERDHLEERLGGIRQRSSVYLLEVDSIENYVIASRVYWAEFDLPFGAASPLASDDQEYREAHPPIGGVVQYAE